MSIELRSLRLPARDDARWGVALDLLGVKWHTVASSGALSAGLRLTTLGRLSEGLRRGLCDLDADRVTGVRVSGVVYSYATPLFVRLSFEDGEARWVELAGDYSVTTSRHRNLIRRALLNPLRVNGDGLTLLAMNPTAAGFDSVADDLMDRDGVAA